MSTKRFILLLALILSMAIGWAGADWETINGLIERVITDSSGNVIENKISTLNSTTTILGPGEVWTGTGEDVTNYGCIYVNSYSDVASATDGLMTQISSDNNTWRNADSYTINAESDKTFSVQPNRKWFRVKYTNGGTIQAVFDLQVKYVVGSCVESSHPIDSDVIGGDDASLNIVVLKVATNDKVTFKTVDVQNPLPIDGDSAYAKDLDLINSDIGTFTGNIETLFSDYHIEITDVTGTNPKTFTLHFRRPVTASQFGFGSLTGNFSNVKLQFKDLAGTIRTEIDDSANNTDYTSFVYPIPPTTFIEVVVEFHTVDEVKISGAFLPKDVSTVSRIQMLKPDGTVVDLNATSGGNAKTSFEEFDESFYTTPLPVIDFGLEVAKGNIVGHSKINKFGEAPFGLQTTLTDIWSRADSTTTQQIWLAPTAARIHTIASTSANDDTGSTGANSVIIDYLPDWDTAETNETVTGDLNAGIAMNNAAVIINRMKVIPQSTSIVTNVGTITATAAVDGTISSVIRPNEGQTEQAIYGISSTQIFYLSMFSANIDKAQGTIVSADFELRVNPNPDVQTIVFIRKEDISLQSNGSTIFEKLFDPPYTIAGPAIIKIQGSATTADTDGESGFTGYVVDN